MKLIYVYHSCYVIEADGFAVIFDYYKDSGASPLEGYVHGELLRRKGRLYVLASHFHPDHFNRDVLKWRQQKEDITYILSSDILEEGKAQAGDGLFLEKGGHWEDGNIHARAFGSTDVGVSFLLRIEGKTIFHAGDLNNWHWKDESTPGEAEEAEQAFLAELEELATAAGQIDWAMFPIDPRLGTDYMRGASQFVSRIRTGLLAPMHFGEAYAKVAAFGDIAAKHNCKLLPLSSKGECFINL
ncbi:hydrolase [Bacteroidia bacterium]|nr:hydrolase [Bacteroidia bacterium]